MSILEGSYNRYLFQWPPFFADLRRFVNQPATPHYLTCTEEAREAVSAEYQIVTQLRVHLEVHPSFRISQLLNNLHYTTTAAVRTSKPRRTSMDSSLFDNPKND